MDLIEIQKQLNPDQLQIFNGEMARGRRTPMTAYLLWFFLCPLGVHKFYLLRPMEGAAYLILGLFTWLFFLTTVVNKSGQSLDVTIVCWVIYGLCWLIDAVTIPLQVRKANDTLGLRIATKLRGFANA